MFTTPPILSTMILSQQQHIFNKNLLIQIYRIIISLIFIFIPNEIFPYKRSVKHLMLFAYLIIMVLIMYNGIIWKIRKSGCSGEKKANFFFDNVVIRCF